MLTIRYGDKERILQQDDSLVFGRLADFDLGDNLWLHRRLGRLAWREGAWWLQNIGTSITIRILDRDSTSRTVLSAKSAAPIGFERAFLHFEAGEEAYRLELELHEILIADVKLPVAPGQHTVVPNVIKLNEEQSLMVTAIAKPRLVDPASSSSNLPANREAAHMLGWSVAKFNRKLDYLCGRLDSLGVGGMRGDASSLAKNRRELLVDYCIEKRLVTADDLETLADHVMNVRAR